MALYSIATLPLLTFFGLRSFGWEIEEERGGGGKRKGESERRRREVGEIERREGTLNRGLGSRRGGGRDYSIKC